MLLLAIWLWLASLVLPHRPWQNERVERFLGTLKAKLDRWAVQGPEQLTMALAEFRTCYNFVRVVAQEVV